MKSFERMYNTEKIEDVPRVVLEFMKDKGIKSVAELHSRWIECLSIEMLHGNLKSAIKFFLIETGYLPDRKPLEEK